MTKVMTRGRCAKNGVDRGRATAPTTLHMSLTTPKSHWHF